MCNLSKKCKNLSFKLLIFLIIFSINGFMTTKTYADGAIDFTHKDFGNYSYGNLWVYHKHAGWRFNKSDGRYLTGTSICFKFMGKGDFKFDATLTGTTLRVKTYLSNGSGSYRLYKSSFVSSIPAKMFWPDRENEVKYRIYNAGDIYNNCFSIKRASVTNGPTGNISFSKTITKTVPWTTGDISCSEFSLNNWGYARAFDAGLLRPDYKLHFYFHNKFNLSLTAKSRDSFGATLKVYRKGAKEPGAIFKLSNDYQTFEIPENAALFAGKKSKDIIFVCDKSILIQQVSATIPNDSSQKKDDASRI